MPMVFDVKPSMTAVDQSEILALATCYGQPVHRTYDIVADEHLRLQRWRAVPDRRGEVVFAIRQPNGKVLLHTKPQYEDRIYRLPSGGINLDEPVEDALLREVAEETGQWVTVQRFVGLYTCRFHRRGDVVSFTSYIFCLESHTAEFHATDTDEIAGYELVAPEHLGHVALALRSLRGRRRRWGYWRSLAHDLVYRYLTCPESLVEG